MLPVIAGIAVVGGLIAWAVSESADSERRQWERDAERIRREMQEHTDRIEAQRAQARRAERRERLYHDHAAARQVADAAYQRLQTAREHRRRLYEARNELDCDLSPVPPQEWQALGHEGRQHVIARQREWRVIRRTLQAVIARMSAQIDALYAKLVAFNMRTAELREALVAA